MSQINDAMLSLTQLSSDTGNPEDSSSVSVHDQNFNNIVTNAFTKFSETDSEYKSKINILSMSAKYTDDPEALVHLQNYLGEYSNYISLVSTLARKTVSTIETLEKAQ
jgi:type III secretion system protein